MFEEIKNNCKLYKLSFEDILNAEKRMKIKFPQDLLKFYTELGYGFVENSKHAINRLLDPGSCADIRLREGMYEFDPDLEMYLPYENKAIIFFEINEGMYASIGINDCKIYFAAEIIANSLVEFLEKIINPDYWAK